MRTCSIDELDRLVRTQRVVCTFNALLLEHYEEQRAKIADQLAKDKVKGLPLVRMEAGRDRLRR